MSDEVPSLKWTSKFQVAPTSRTPKLLGDKVTLPPSALEALLAAAPVVSTQNGDSHTLTSTFDPFNPYTYAAERRAREQLADRQQQLPHPLTFRVVNPDNGRTVHAGIREFSAEDGEIGLSPFLRDVLGLTERSPRPVKDSQQDDGVETEEHTPHTVTIHAKTLPKGTYVRLRPLEAGYDPGDWKSLLEKYLRNNFTTLTMNEVLSVPVSRHEQFNFLVDKFEPEGEGVCIVDTDLEVDIEALNEEQARETLNRRLAKSQRALATAEGSSVSGVVLIERESSGQVVSGEYVDYELKEWNRAESLHITLETGAEDAGLDLFVSPFSARQRSRPRDDEHLFADFSGSLPKRLRLSPTNIELEDVEAIYISVHAYRDEKAVPVAAGHPIPYTLVATAATAEITSEVVDDPVASPDEVICKNCHQAIPERTLPLHEAFCYRNNIACPQCSNVFLKNSPSWKNHWHCPHDDEYGSTTNSKKKHDSIFHPSNLLQCPNCDFEAYNLPLLARHRTSTCPGKEILCQFCHLVVPQQGPDDPSFTDPEVLLSGLTPHELADGARTTECHLCNKIVRLRDMRTHLKFHDRDRLSRPKPHLCRNVICGRTVRAQDWNRIQNEQLSLCSECFGPLYVTSYDPEGKALRRRIERRLLQQLMAGCGKRWCTNASVCRTGKKNASGVDEVVTAKDALPRTKPTMDALAKKEPIDLKFCVDEVSQRRRATAEMLAAEAEYELEWCVKALEEEGGDLGRTGQWLKDRAPRIGEVVR